MSRAGYELTVNPEEADAIIVNTCGFIQEAKEESIETILELAILKEKGRCRRLVVAGCLPQRYRTDLSKELPEVDYFLGIGEIERITGILMGEMPDRVVVGDSTSIDYRTDSRILSTPAGTAYVKISEGCSNHCSYCAIPLIRGELRSRDEDAIIREIDYLASKGVKEINLIAQDTTSYGKDVEGRDLEGLLRRIVKVRGIEWIRLLYLHPKGLKRSLIELIRDEEKICNYIDLPLQHIDDTILRSMNRGVDRRGIIELIETIRHIIPDATLRTTFIVGFPGEDDRAFEELIRFVEDMEFDRVGAFKYSREEGTPSYNMAGQVPEEVKEERYRRLMEVQRGISRKKNRRLIGSICRGIVEGVSEETPHLLKARLVSQAPDVDGVTYINDVKDKEIMAGDMVELMITDAGDFDLVAEVV